MFLILGEKITEIPVESPTFTCSWNPKYMLLAYACDDKDKYNRDRDAGTVKLYGVANDSWNGKEVHSTLK